MEKILCSSAIGLLLSSMSGLALALPEYDSSIGFSGGQCGSESEAYISESDVTLGGSNASTCFGAYGGNNGNELLWNENTWQSYAKIEESDDGSFLAEGGFSLSFDAGSDSSGTWNFSGDFSGWDSIFIVTKASNDPGWAAYFFDNLGDYSELSGTFSIPWTANGNENAGVAGLSHLSLYTRQATQVPEPGTLSLIGLGLIGLGLSRRSRRIG